MFLRHSLYKDSAAFYDTLCTKIVQRFYDTLYKDSAVFLPHSLYKDSAAFLRLSLYKDSAAFLRLSLYKDSAAFLISLGNKLASFISWSSDRTIVIGFLET